LVHEYNYLNAVTALLSRRLERSGSRQTSSTFTRRQLLHPPVTSSPRYNIETFFDNLELSFTSTAIYFCEKEPLCSSVADPGSLSLIPDPNFSIPDSGSRVKKIPDPGSASKNLSIFNPKNCFYALGNMVWDVHPGSRIQGSKGTGSRIRIRNTGV
jgi:hypothetical protein